MSEHTVEQALSAWVRVHLESACPGLDPAAIKADVSAAADERFGDYQCNAAMSLARLLNIKPRELAERIAALPPPPGIARLSVAGPGFINFHLDEPWMALQLEAIGSDPSLGVPEIGRGQTIVIDYSSPNIAKPMHVGHIRSTVIGHALDRIHRFLGYRVIADNHLGDWGKQFGMLILGWKRHLDPIALEADPIAEMERLYRLVHAACEADAAVEQEAKRELVALQQGDAENLALWKRMYELSQSQFDSVYRRLGVSFDVTLGESYYNPRLPAVVEEFLERGIARESQGAVAVFSDGRSTPEQDPFLIRRDGDWQPNPCIIRKEDGGYNYATTDLATLAYRVETWNPASIIYVTDGRQQLHFRQLFQAFQRWKPDVAVRLEHVWFGTILGPDGKPFKTRSGDTVKLAELLDEAVDRALRIVEGKSPEMPAAERESIARMVGLGALKYSDLQSNRQNDYVFSWDRMLAMDGNTAPYLQYACARIRSVLDKYEEKFPGRSWNDHPLKLADPAERILGLRVLQFADVVRHAAAACRPNMLCDYLFNLAQAYSGFYQAVPFLKAEEGVRESRIRLSAIVARTLRKGLDLLGIQAPERI